MDTATEGGGDVVDEGPGTYSVVQAQEPIPELDGIQEDAEPEEFVEEPEEGLGELDENSVEALEGALDGEDPSEVPEEPPAPESRVLTIDGKEVEVTADEAFKRYELVQASYQRMEDAAKIRSDVKGLFGTLRNADAPTLAQFLAKLGHDPVQFATELGADVLRRDKMTPEQREIEDLRRQQAQMQRDQQRRAEQQRQAYIAQRQPVEEARIHGEYMSAMDEAGVPPSEKLREGLIQRMAGRQLKARRQGIDMPVGHALAMEWEALQAVAKHQTEHLRKQRLAAAPERQRIQPKKRAPAPRSSTSAQEYQTYGAGDLDSFKALLDAD